MRVRPLIFTALVVAAPTSAYADKQLDELRVMYEKEGTGCARSRDGLARIVDGATELQKTIAAGDKPALDKDLATLTAGLATVKGYCAELDGALEVLRANPTAKYRTLERDLDARDNRIRKGRAGSKKVLADLGPIQSKWIAKINAARVSGSATPVPDKGTLVTFPSGRTTSLKSLAPNGTWKISGGPAVDTAEFVDARSVSVVTISTRSFTAATCEQQKRVATNADDTKIAMVEGDTIKPYAWRVTFTRKSRQLAVACASLPDGGIVATLDTLDGTLVDASAAFLAKMTEARLPAAPTGSGK